jgi:hypothetical protein
VPLETEPSPSEVEIPTEKLKWHKSPGTDKILTQLIQAQDETLCSEIHKLIISIWNMEGLFQQLEKSILLTRPDRSNY